MTSAIPDGGPIRILAILDDTVLSGKVKPVLNLARSAREDKDAIRRLDISMLTFSRTESEPPLVTSLRREGFVIDVVHERRRFDFGVFPQLRAIINRRQPHLLWTHGAKTHFLVRLAGLHRGTAWVAFHHGYTATSLVWRLYDQLDRWSLRAADGVMVPCEAFAADLSARLGIRPGVLHVHRTPIMASTPSTPHADASRLRRELGLASDARVVLSVGRLSLEKGYADLIRAMVQIRRMSDSQTVLVIVGDGPERARLESICARSDLVDAVRLVGYQHDVTAYYAAADVFVLPSYSEGSPNVLLEAINAGIPIVASAVGGVPEMVIDRKHALLVRAGDVEGIARSVVALLRDPELRAALTVAARQLLPAYSPEQYYDNVRSVFAATVAECRRTLR